MNESQNKSSFSYSYSSDEQREISKIRDKYTAKEESGIDRLRRLDKSATMPGTVVSVIVGIIGVLLFGTGMSCVMVWSESAFIIGIVLGLSGIALAAAAYPIYSQITKMRRKKLAPEIIRLTDELSQK